MSAFQLGSFVTHQKLPELGAGEIVACERGALRIRFAGGERSFAEEVVQQHLALSSEGPPPAPTAKSARAKSARKAKSSS